MCFTQEQKDYLSNNYASKKHEIKAIASDNVILVKLEQIEKMLSLDIQKKSQLEVRLSKVEAFQNGNKSIKAFVVDNLTIGRFLSMMSAQFLTLFFADIFTKIDIESIINNNGVQLFTAMLTIASTYSFIRYKYDITKKIGENKNEEL